jgi:AcrR family transcriptional regulator
MARPTRSYRSPRREQQARDTRVAILRAARDLFAAKGWAATGMRDIATAAGVSVETVYGTVGSKTAVFAAALDGAVAGDDEPIAVRDRPEFRELGTARSLAARAAQAAAYLTALQVRTAHLDRALREAAASDPALAAQLRASEERRRQSFADGAVLVAGRPVTEDERDALWALGSFEMYDALVGRSGWTQEQYQAWLARAIVGELRRRREPR